MGCRFIGFAIACTTILTAPYPLAHAESAKERIELWSAANSPTKAMKWLQGSGWEEQKGSADDWTIDAKVLCTRQSDNSTTIGKRVDLALSLLSPVHLDGRLKVSEQPKGADLGKKSLEDSAVRIFVVFREGGGFLKPPNTIGYAYSERHRPGTWINSERFANVKFLVIGDQASAKNKWLSFHRNLAEDYRKAFQSDIIPDIAAVAVKSDANNTGTRASACIADLALIRQKDLAMRSPPRP